VDRWAALVKITAEKLSRKTLAKYQKVAQSESLVLKWQRQHKRFDGELSINQRLVQ